MTPTPKPFAGHVATLNIDFGARTITLTSLTGDALTLPVEPSGVQIAISSGHERPKVTVPARDLSYYDEISGLKSRPATRAAISPQQ